MHYMMKELKAKTRPSGTFKENIYGKKNVFYGKMLYIPQYRHVWLSWTSGVGKHL